MGRWARVPTTKSAEKGLSSDAAYAVSRFGGGNATAALRRDNWDILKADSEGFKRVTWVFRCVDVIASAQADRAIRWRTGDRRKGPMLASHPLDTVLNSLSNDLEDSWQFRYRLSGQLLLSTRGVFVEVLRDRLDRVAGLGLIPPQWTKPVPDPQRYYSGFEVRAPGADPKFIDRDNVVWIRKPDLIDPLAAVTPLQAASLAVDMDYLLHLYNRTFLINDGRPGGLIVVKGDMEESDKEELRSRFGGNINRAGRVSVIASDDGADWVDTAVTPRDAQYETLAKLTQEEILLAFGVPKSQMGDASGRTYDNADAEDETFWEKTMIGHCGLIERGFDQLDDDPKVLCSFDFSDVDSLITAEYRRRAGLLLEYKSGAITKNEYRLATGRDVVDGGDEFAGSNPLAFGAAPSLDAVPPAKALGAAEDPPDWVGWLAQLVMGTRGAPVALPAPLAEPNDAADVQDAILVDPFAFSSTEKSAFMVKVAGDQERWEKTFAKTAKRFFDRQRSVVLDKLNGAKTARAFVKGTKPTAESLLDEAVWNRQLEDDFLPLIRSVQDEFGSIVAARAGVTFDVDAAEVELARQAQMARMFGVNGTTFAKIEAALAEGATAGEAIPALAERVAAVFDAARDYRADMLARTEVISSSNGGLILAAKQGGVATTKTWVTAQDERVRDTHAEADGQEVALDEPFLVGVSELDAPGDPNGDPGEVINCRCVVWFGSSPAADPEGGDLPTDGG